MSNYNDMVDLLSSVSNMSHLVISTKYDDNSYVINNVPSFVKYKNNQVSSIYVNGNSWIGFGSASEHFKYNRRDACMYDLWVEQGIYASTYNFYRIRWGGYSHFTASSDWKQIYDLVIFDTGDMMLYVNTFPFSYSTGTYSFDNVNYNVPTQVSRFVSFYIQQDGTYSIDYNPINYVPIPQRSNHTIDFTNAGWKTDRPDVFEVIDSSIPFYVDDTFTFELNPTYRSGAIPNNSQTYSEIDFSLANSGYIKFNYIVSSEEADRFCIYIDGEKVVYISGEGSVWTEFMSNMLSSGNHILKLEYNKDVSSTRGHDAGAVGYITFYGILDSDVKKFLIQSGDNYYKIVNGSLVQLSQGTVLSSSTFIQHGFDSLPTWSDISSLSNPKILYWQSLEPSMPTISAEVVGYPLVDQKIVTDNMNISHSSIVGFSEISVIASSDASFFVSFDDGPWKVYDDGVWEDSTIGMSKAEFEAIPLSAWDSLIGLAEDMKLRIDLNGQEMLVNVTIDFDNE